MAALRVSPEDLALAFNFPPARTLQLTLLTLFVDRNSIRFVVLRLSA